jgi:signal transduction histidine kinase
MNRLPVRVRLTLPFALAMLVVLAALGTFVYVGVGRAMLSTTDVALRVQADDSSRHVDVGEDPLDRDALESATIAQEFSATGAVTYSSRTFGASLLSAAEVERVAHGATIKTFAHPPSLEGPWRILAFPVKTPSGTVVVAIGRSAGERAETLDHLKHGFLLAVPAALLAATIAGYLLAASALRPVEEMRRRAQAISASTPDSRLPVPTARDEVRRLAETLNEMLDRLQDSFEHERRFLADASHELRTPLALLQTELDLALRRPRSPEELEAALRSAAEETVRLTRLAEDLLLLARSDQGELTVRPEQLSARALLEECVSRFHARVEGSGRSLTIEPGDDISFSGDPLRVEQALSNLLENAFVHGAGDVTVAAEAEGAMVAFHVRDDGRGFPAGFADRAFDRFTRADEARSTSGTGLGLAIVAAIARAHGGNAEIRPRTVGADIALVLPRL